MPSILGPKPAPKPRVLVPRRVGLAYQSELDRSAIPERVTLTQDSVPFAGELREEDAGNPITQIPPGGFATLATLRRPWNFVGFAVDPGNTPPAVGVPPVANAFVVLRILVRGVKGYTTTTQFPILGVGPQAFINQIVGAACELVFINQTNLVAPPGISITGVRGTIWGMGER